MKQAAIIFEDHSWFHATIMEEDTMKTKILSHVKSKTVQKTKNPKFGHKTLSLLRFNSCFDHTTNFLFKELQVRILSTDNA